MFAVVAVGAEPLRDGGCQIRLVDDVCIGLGISFALQATALFA